MTSSACQPLSSLSLRNPIAFTDPSLSVQVIANGLSAPRHILLDSLNNLLVVDRGRGIVALTETSTCWNQSLVISDSTLNTGIALSGTTLYASSSDALYSWDYDAGSLATSNKQMLVQGMSNTDHDTRTIVLEPGDSPSYAIIGRGSDSNINPNADADNQAQIRQFPLTTNGTARDWTEGTLLASGIRNAVGMAMSPGDTSVLYAVENSADDLVIPSGQNVAHSNPAEKMNMINISAAALDYGYPNCFTVFDGSPFPTDPDTGQLFSIVGNISDSQCALTTQAPRLVFPAHYAPLDIKFLTATNTSFDSTWVDSAFVTSHGSWDTTPPAGYALLRVPFETTAWQPVDPVSTQHGFETIFSAPNLTACPNGCFRPVGLAIERKQGGGMFVSGDATGEIIRIYRTDEARSGAISRRMRGSWLVMTTLIVHVLMSVLMH